MFLYKYKDKYFHTGKRYNLKNRNTTIRGKITVPVNKNNYADIKINIDGIIRNVKIEKGCSFENNGGTYKVDKNGKLSIFDKNTNTGKSVSSIKMTNYQFGIFKNMADNVNEGFGSLTLSVKDIQTAQNLHAKGKFTADVSKNLPQGYKIQNAERSSSGNYVMLDVFNKVKNTVQATLKFGFEKNSAATGSQAAAQSCSGIFNNPNIREIPARIHVLKKGEDIVSLARKYEIDTYQIIAANPQLKEGRDYTVKYSKSNLASISTNLKEGTKITIPARYVVKEGSIKSIDDVARVTGVSKSYLKDLLTVTEVKASHPGKPDLTTYGDLGNDKGTPTIGYGHTGRVDGKPLSFKHKITITNAKACELLANDILKHQSMCIAHLGKSNYEKAPLSVQAAVLDTAYNKGIWDGFKNKYYNQKTKQIKTNLQNGHYATALCNTRRTGTGLIELKRRNVYRFISGLKDLPASKQKAAIKAYEQYYLQVRNQCTGLDRKYLEQAWNNAVHGKTTNYRMKAAQKDRV